MPVRIKLPLGEFNTGILIDKKPWNWRGVKITIQSIIGNVGQCNIDHTDMVFHVFSKHELDSSVEMVLPLNLRGKPCVDIGVTPSIEWDNTLKLTVKKSEEMQTLDIPLIVHGIIVEIECGDELGPEKNRHPKFTLLRNKDFDLIWSLLPELRRFAGISDENLKEIRKSVKFRNPGRDIPQLDSGINQAQAQRVVGDWKRRQAHYNQFVGKDIYINRWTKTLKAKLVGVVPSREFLSIDLKVIPKGMEDVLVIQEGELDRLS